MWRSLGLAGLAKIKGRGLDHALPSGTCKRLSEKTRQAAPIWRDSSVFSEGMKNLQVSMAAQQLLVAKAFLFDGMGA
jgi:hypothetical protein